MGYIHADQVYGFHLLQMDRVGRDGVNEGQTLNRDFTAVVSPSGRDVVFMLPGSALVHGVLMRWLSSSNGTTPASDNPTFTFTFRDQSTVGQQSNALNIIADMQTAVGDTTAGGAVCWIPSVQARRFAAGTDSGPTFSGPFHATSGTVWPSGDWLGSSVNNSRFLAAFSGAGAYAFPRFVMTIIDPGGAGGALGQITGLTVYAAVTIFPPMKSSVQSYEVVEADEIAARNILGVGEFGAERAPAWLGLSAV